ncbi:unnamed protein product [Protopolystoma xenopodis]|uniref:Secreted protein n=1 Tax=Protopolystoma xenopodis TaxID=117903 RepID=A0A448WMT2_9PLAT|nr:unnamed protein product [Protopolystoma xenopodis]
MHSNCVFLCPTLLAISGRTLSIITWSQIFFDLQIGSALSACDPAEHVFSTLFVPVLLRSAHAPLHPPSTIVHPSFIHHPPSTRPSLGAAYPRRISRGLAERLIGPATRPSTVLVGGRSVGAVRQFGPSEPRSGSRPARRKRRIQIWWTEEARDHRSSCQAAICKIVFVVFTLSSTLVPCPLSSPQLRPLLSRPN